jgi:hypothetical protein
MMLAESHYHGHAGMDIWPFVLAIVFIGVIVALVVLVLLWRKSQRVENRSQGGSQPIAPPGASASTSQIPVQPHPSGGDAVQQAARMGDYLHCEDTILEVLRQKGRPMAQKEICEDTGLTEQEVAGALAFMEERAMVKRTWDRGQSAYMVEAT